MLPVFAVAERLKNGAITDHRNWQETCLGFLIKSPKIQLTPPGTIAVQYLVISELVIKY